jgi:hypothetical protein
MPSVVALFSTYPESYLFENAFCIMKKAYFCSRNKHISALDNISFYHITTETVPQDSWRVGLQVAK